MDGETFAQPLCQNLNYLVETLDLVPLEVHMPEVLEAVKIEVDVAELIVRQVELRQVGQGAKHVFGDVPRSKGLQLALWLMAICKAMPSWKHQFPIKH